jgi:hypothetical protein
MSLCQEGFTGNVLFSFAVSHPPDKKKPASLAAAG